MSARPTCWRRSTTRCRGPKAFATFVELTQLVGALGFINTVERLSEHTVITIDEFRLDDPGDTMLVPPY